MNHKQYFKYLVSVSMCFLFNNGCNKDNDSDNQLINPIDSPYTVEIDPADFADTNISGNTFFPTAGESGYEDLTALVDRN